MRYNVGMVVAKVSANFAPLSAMVFTCLVSCVAFVLLWRRRVRVSKLPEHPLLRTQQLQLTAEYSDAVEMVVNALRVMKMQILSVDPNKGFVHSLSGWSWRTFGQYLDVRISHEGDEKVTLDIWCWPKPEFAIFDYGAGHHEIAEFIDELVRQSPENTVALTASS
jgi:hypothetical protein